LPFINARTVPEICAMGGITVDDFSSSVAYREIFGLGQQEGEQKGRQEGPARPKPLPSPCACLGIAAAP